MLIASKQWPNQSLSKDQENTYICNTFMHEYATQSNKYFSMAKKQYNFKGNFNDYYKVSL